MAYKVNVENPCSCFFKSGMVDMQKFESQEDAKKEAEDMLRVMNSTFCNKHTFVMTEQFGDYTIYIRPRI